MRSRSTVRPVLAIAALAAFSGGPALAGGGYDITAFTGADLDISGDLSIAEFNTTLDPGLSGKAQAKSFRRADLNRNGSIQVNEFLIFRDIIRPRKAFEWWFYRADISIDGALSFGEFTSGFKAKASMVSIRRDFLEADVNGDWAVTLVEYSNFRRGLIPPTDFTIFELADMDVDGQLTVGEFGHIYSRSTPEALILERFLKLDDNSDGVLKPGEWNPGVVR